jgi:serine/threonine-protein kinase
MLGARYRLEALLARGGMADVWRATDTVLERAVAVKILHPHLGADPSFVGRFRTEAIAAARLRHPNIVAVFDTCSDPGAEAIVMELIAGPTLREHLDHHGPLDPDEAAELGADLADALHAAHRAGLVHRDVKPANVLLSDDERVLLTDFGIAKVRDEADRTQTGAMLGSVKYLSPEQVEGKPVDARTDVYSLGVVLYEAVTAKVPFTGDTPAATALARLHQKPTRPRQIRPRVPKGLDDVIMRAIEVDPGARFATTADFRSALLATVPRPVPTHDPDATVADRRPVATPAATNAPGSDHWGDDDVDDNTHRRSLGFGTVVLVLVVVAMALGGALLWRANQVEDSSTPRPASTPVPASGDPEPLVAVAATAFDPQGSPPPPGENDDLAPLAIDGNPDTAWSTEGYNTRDFDAHRLKAGVGLWVDLGSSQAVTSVELLSPTRDWSATIYAADAPGTTLADWGEPVGGGRNLGADDRIAIDGATGRYVLVWITDLGNGPAQVKAELAEVRVRR